MERRQERTLIRLDAGDTLRRRFQIVRKLDPDAFGARFYAVDREEGGRALVRAVPMDFATRRPILDNLDLLAGLDRSKLSRLLGYGIDHGTIFVAHAHSAKPRLNQDQARRPLPLDEFEVAVATIMGPVCEAHSKGLAIGGVVPEQVLIRSEGSDTKLELELADFGMATVFDPTSAAVSQDNLARDLEIVSQTLANLLIGDAPPERGAAAWLSERSSSMALPPKLVALLSEALEGESIGSSLELSERLNEVLSPSPVTPSSAGTRSPAPEAKASPPTTEPTSPTRMAPQPSTPKSVPATPASASSSGFGPRPRVGSDTRPYRVPIKRKSDPSSVVAGWLLAGIVAVGIGGLGWIAYAGNWAEMLGGNPASASGSRASTESAGAVHRPRAGMPIEESESDAQHKGTLILEGPKGAKVLVDGEAVGALPFEGELDPGSHRVEVHADGRPSWSRDVEIAKGLTEELNVELEEDETVVRAKARSRSRRRSRARARRRRAEASSAPAPTPEYSESVEPTEADPAEAGEAQGSAEFEEAAEASSAEPAGVASEDVSEESSDEEESAMSEEQALEPLPEPSEGPFLEKENGGESNPFL